jgi:hypothetical protein
MSEQSGHEGLLTRTYFKFELWLDLYVMSTEYIENILLILGACVSVVG